MKHGDDYETTTHDEGDLWAGKARSGWERCGGCGEEWGTGDDPSCVCHKEREAVLLNNAAEAQEEEEIHHEG